MRIQISRTRARIWVALGLAGVAGCGSPPGGKPPGGDASVAVDAPAAGEGGVALDARARGDSSPPVTSPDPSPPVVLTILPSPDPARPFQHAAEVSIAAQDGHVVVAAINIHTDGEQTLAAAAILRGVGIAVSHDFGATFEPTADPGFVAAGGDDTSDPVVRVGANGTFWLSAMVAQPDSSFGEKGMLLRSGAEGRSWKVVQPALPIVDKEWIAVTGDGGLVLGANGGFLRFDAGGTVTASWIGGPDWPVMGAYVDARGAHFVLQRSVALWTGGQMLTFEGAVVDTTLSSWAPGWSVPIGPTDDGGTWAIYDRQPMAAQPTEAVVELRLFADADTVGEVVPISDPGVAAFMPAAALDGEGRLHVIWYESSGAQGLLKYARSVGRDLHLGFSPARIVDADACPGQGWIPQYSASAPDRRLREYVDLAIDGHRVHAAWTHAPSLPSRIYTSHWDF